MAMTDLNRRAALVAAMLTPIAASACSRIDDQFPRDGAGDLAEVNVDLTAARADPGRTKVAILIFDEVQVIDYSGPLEVLSDAGFDVFTVAETKAPVTTSAGDAVMLTPKYGFADAPQVDLLVIPGGGFEAPGDSATVAWIRAANEHAAHIMSVCNGAFTLANTGLLDGKSATTTAGNINRFRQTFPAINVTPDARVVDNGRIIVTAGLSAGIDGALHMIDRIKGEGAARSVAQAIEYDWRPDAPYVRGVMADRLIPSVYGALNEHNVSDPFDVLNVGDQDRWDRVLWYLTPQTPADLLTLLKTAFEQGYAVEGGAWAPGTFRFEPVTVSSATIRFDDRDGRHWSGALETAAGAEASQVAWKLAIRRAG